MNAGHRCPWSQTRGEVRENARAAPEEARLLLDSIDTGKPIGLRERALIGLMVYTFARIGAATAMRVEDVFVQNCRLWVRLHEKGGKAVALPCHHNLETYLHAYLDGTGIQGDSDGPLFRTVGRGTARLTRTLLPARDVFSMVRCQRWSVPRHMNKVFQLSEMFTIVA